MGALADPARPVRPATGFLLDEMLPARCVALLARRGLSAAAVVTDPALSGRPDAEVFEHARAEGLCLVTANIKDFVALDAAARARGESHAGLLLVAARTLPHGPRLADSLSRPLARAHREGTLPGRGEVGFLSLAR